MFIGNMRLSNRYQVLQKECDNTAPEAENQEACGDAPPQVENEKACVEDPPEAKNDVVDPSAGKTKETCYGTPFVKNEEVCRDTPTESKNEVLGPYNGKPKKACNNTLLEAKNDEVCHGSLTEAKNEVLGHSDDKTTEEGRILLDLFVIKARMLLRETVAAPRDEFGETLEDEMVHRGAYVDDEAYILEKIPNAQRPLYGVEQFQRAMAEFRFLVRRIKCPQVTCDEIMNICGDIDDGIDYSRSACILAAKKTRHTLEPVLHQLGRCLLHIIKRVFPIAVYLIQEDGEFPSGRAYSLLNLEFAFHRFAESIERSCSEKCMEDLEKTTSYVTWSLQIKSRERLHKVLQSFGSVVDERNTSMVPMAHGETNIFEVSSKRDVDELVQGLFNGIREHFAVSVALKYNCYLLMPLVEKLQTFLQNYLESEFGDDLGFFPGINGLKQIEKVTSGLIQKQPNLQQVPLEQVCDISAQQQDSLIYTVFDNDLFKDYIGVLKYLPRKNEMGKFVYNYPKPLEKEEEERLIRNLKNRLQPFVDGRSADFVKWATLEADRLSCTDFGDRVVRTIGYVYKIQACKEIGRKRVYPFLQEWLREKVHNFNSGALAMGGMSFLREYYKVRNFNAENGKKMRDHMWLINAEDIEVVVSKVCQAACKVKA